MIKNVRIGELLEIYSSLLTEKQVDLLDLYYNQDLSLAEIAEEKKVSRQAVIDIIKKGENKLFFFEEKLSIMEKTRNNEKIIQKVLDKLSEIDEDSNSKSIEKILNEIQKQLKCIV